LSGGKDGLVQEVSVEGGQIKVVRTVLRFDLADSLNVSVKVLDAHQSNLLVGTGGNDLFLIENWRQSSSKKRVLSGHFGQELWGLACHPSAQVYSTCGDDMTIKTWDIASRKMLAKRGVGIKLRAIDYSKCGKWLVAGSMCGKLVLADSDLTGEPLIIQTTFSSANQWIEELKFSPNNKFVAFGAHGGVSPLMVYAFSGKSLTPYASIKVGLTSALLHLDWSEDSCTVVVNSQAYELKFADIQSKQSIPARSVKDVEWASWTCKIGWPVQGIFPGVMGSEVNAVCRSDNRQLLATGENSQLVKLFKYPCAVEKANFNSYLAHSSFVTRVRFSAKDAFLISVGGHDNTSIVWTTDFCSDPHIQPIEASGVGAEDVEDDEEVPVVHRKGVKDKFHQRGEEQQQEAEEAVIQGGFEVQTAEEDNEFMAVKPWLGAIRAPSDPAQAVTSDLPPTVDVSLEYVHGYRAKDCRNNVIWSQNCLYYNAAGLAVCLEPRDNTQTFFDEHQDDVISIAHCPATDNFATGEIGPKPRLFVWSAKGMKPLGRLEGGVIKGIVGLAFSPKGDYLVATCIDDNHHVALYDLRTMSLVACEKGDTANILAVDFTSDTEFSTVGLRHFKSWKVGPTLKGSRGNFGKASDRLVCGKRFKGSLLCGSVTGELQLWSGGSVSKILKVHKSTLDAICVTSGNHVLTGGRDGKLNVLDSTLTLVHCLDLNGCVKQSLSNQIRSISIDSRETEVFIGTFSAEIFSLSSNKSLLLAAPNTDKLNVRRLLSGHYARNAQWTNEIWGLTALSNSRYITVSDDGTLRLWSAVEHRELNCLKMDVDIKGVPLEKDKVTGDLVDSAKLRSVAVCQEEKHVAVGCLDGTVRIVNVEKWQQIRIIRNRKRWISDIKYSPNNEFMAVGSHDAIIDIYKVTDKYRLMFSMKKHSAFITHLDWSLDSNYLHSNCGAHELLFFDANTGRQLTSGASALRDEAWATWSCVLGWPVQGIFKENWDGTDIDMVDRSHGRTREGRQVIAVANDFGKIDLYNFPCLRKSAQSMQLRGHSSHVTNVKFSPDDEFLFSTGGEDQTVMQWKIRLN
jgi:microtubule-associated protein-like 6